MKTGTLTPWHCQPDSTDVGVSRRHVITSGGMDTPLRLVPVAMAAAAAVLGYRMQRPRLKTV